MAAQRHAAAVRAAAKSGEPDRYLTALLAPSDKRDALVALAAFASEVARIPRTVSDPMMQRIRIQWWRDALSAGMESGDLSGHPIADAVISGVRTHGLPFDELTSILEAWQDAIEQIASHDAQDLVLDFPVDAGIGHFILSARVCGAPENKHLRDLVNEAGQAYEPARTLLSQSWTVGKQLSSARYSKTLCLQHLASSRALLAEVPRRQRLAFLPLTMVGPYLDTAQPRETKHHDNRPKVGPLSRIWRIWWAYCTGRP